MVRHASTYRVVDQKLHAEVSEHRSQVAAWKEADPAQSSLGGSEGYRMTFRNGTMVIAAAITIPDEHWEDIGNEPGARLLGTLQISNVLFHVNAWRVESDGAFGIQEAVEDDENFGIIHAALGADGHWQTVKINGHDYVLIIEPFCS